ncbi:MAG: hypothetical protein JXK07_03155 [Spirochaetes bacterium]|nr:hypothetical protein [Spirochaetota bacterium]
MLPHAGVSLYIEHFCISRKRRMREKELLKKKPCKSLTYKALINDLSRTGTLILAAKAHCYRHPLSCYTLISDHD